MNLLALVPWYWRLGAIVALAAAVYGAGWVKGLERGEDELEQFKAAAERAGDAQNAHTAATVQAWKSLKEISDAESRAAAADRDAALERVRALQRAAADRRIVPTASAGAGGSDRLCLSRDELDRRFRASFARLSERLIGIAEQGQRGVDVAAQCQAWAARLGKVN